MAAMTKRDAFTHAQAILGHVKGITYQGTRQQTTPERRAQAHARLTRLRTRKQKLDEEIGIASRVAREYRHTLHERQGLFHLVIAKGDTWEDVLEQLKAYQKARINQGPVVASLLLEAERHQGASQASR